MRWSNNTRLGDTEVHQVHSDDTIYTSSLMKKKKPCSGDRIAPSIHDEEVRILITLTRPALRKSRCNFSRVNAWPRRSLWRYSVSVCDNFKSQLWILGKFVLLVTTLKSIKYFWRFAAIIWLQQDICFQLIQRVTIRSEKRGFRILLKLGGHGWLTNNH